MTRDRLPNRRPNESETLEVNGKKFEACVGFDPESGWPREVFLTGGKEGSHDAAILSDVATIISVSIQHGVPLTALVKSVGRLPDLTTAPGSLGQLAAGSQPATAAGAALDFLLRLEPREAFSGIREHDHR